MFLILLVPLLLHAAVQHAWLGALANTTHERRLPFSDSAWVMAKVLCWGYPVFVLSTLLISDVERLPAFEPWLQAFGVPGVALAGLFAATWRRWTPPLLVVIGGPVATLVAMLLRQRAGGYDPLGAGLLWGVGSWYLITVPGVLVWAARLPAPRPTCCRGCQYDLRGLAPDAACPECGAARARPTPELGVEAERTQ